MFSSRFRGGDPGNFPLRQYLRCRDDFNSGLVHLGLLIAFGVMLVVFARALDRTLGTHAPDLSTWIRFAVLAAMGLFVLSVLRRLYYKVVELREIRREMSRLQADFRKRDDEPTPGPGPDAGW